jgi:hypothetical protein
MEAFQKIAIERDDFTEKGWNREKAGGGIHGLPGRITGEKGKILDVF